MASQKWKLDSTEQMFKTPTIKRFYVKNYPYFITTTTYKKKPILANKKKANMLRDMIYNFRNQNRYLLLSFVIMPDHLHLLLVPNQNNDISKIMHSIKRGSARLINKGFDSSGKIWEPRFSDKVARTEKELLGDIKYMHLNPVRNGLVEKPEDYPFSTANPKFENDLEKYFNGKPPRR